MILIHAFNFLIHLCALKRVLHLVKGKFIKSELKNCSGYLPQCIDTLTNFMMSSKDASFISNASLLLYS